MSNPSLVLLQRVFAMTSAFSWQNSITLCPASFCTPGPNLTVTPCCYKILYFILCYSWVTFHGMYVCAYTPHFLCPFICQWIFGLFLCLGYYEQCCCEHCGACIFLKLRVLSGWLLFLPLHGCWVVLSLPQVAHLKKISCIKKLLQTYETYPFTTFLHV